MIDSHCHLADDAFSSDIVQVVERASAVGVDQALCILDVTNEEELGRAGGLVQLWSAVQFAAGVHPHQAGQFEDCLDEVLPTFEAALKRHSDVCAVGEIGLDYHYDVSPRNVQVEVFLELHLGSLRRYQERFSNVILESLCLIVEAVQPQFLSHQWKL